MEVKSRFEVIANLENEKRKLIFEKNNLNTEVEKQERTIKIFERELEDKKEDLKNFKDKLEEKKSTIEEMIKSIDTNLATLSNLSTK
jgi:predicted  nucleic acid-binding Zn-ribbon protein